VYVLFSTIICKNYAFISLTSFGRNFSHQAKCLQPNKYCSGHCCYNNF